MSDHIITAFEQILEELEETRNLLADKITVHATQQRFDEVVALGQQGTQLESFCMRVAQLRDEWRQQFATLQPAPTPTTPTAPKRHNHGLRTPQHVYYQPILQVLVDAGGQARSAFVVSNVYPKVKHLLNAYDHEPLPSSPKETRWANAVAWARNDLREQGLLISNSPQGVWEISAAGRAWLAMQPRVGE
jgi:restriction system protein